MAASMRSLLHGVTVPKPLISGQPSCDEDAKTVDAFGPVVPARGTSKMRPSRTSMEVVHLLSPCPRARTSLKSPSLHSVR